jgi:Fe-Mn family superoxide dismutase
MFFRSVLPYAENALEPYISKNTVNFHYHKHHQTYVDNLNKLLEDFPSFMEEDPSLEKVILEFYNYPKHLRVFNNAAQVWNHDFFWKSMKHLGGGKPTGPILKKIEENFDSYENFCSLFIESGLSQFGSGWVWLVETKDHHLEIIKTANADLPMVYDKKALITCDVWEHAYYLDYQNRRKDFLQVFLDHLVNWDFAVANLLS